MFARRIFVVAVVSALALEGGCKKEEESTKDEEVPAKKSKKAAEPADDDPPAKKKKKSTKASLCPATFVELADHDSADEQSCTCEEEHIGGAVFGSGVYTEFSSPCAAAVHAGVIKKSGGDITVQHSKGCDSYSGSTKNGITAHGWGKFEGSFFFPEKGAAKCTKSDACPATFKDIKDRDEDTEITCACAANPSGSVWGSAIYTQDSSICNAAVHSGAIAKDDGGSVTARAAPGCKTYAGSTANAVTSSSWGDYETSFFFPSKGDGICKTPKVVVAAKYKASDVVDILWNGSWYEGSILAVATGDKYRVHYAGYGASWDEWVTGARLRTKTGKANKGSGAAIAPTASVPSKPSASTALAPSASASTAPAVTTSSFAVGEAVNILWKGSWYPGKIIGVSGALYRVHYDGYDASWDESVSVGRLKKK